MTLESPIVQLVVYILGGILQYNGGTPHNLINDPWLTTRTAGVIYSLSLNVVTY